MSVKNLKLSTLATHFGYSFKAHVAAEDVYANIEVMKELKAVLTNS